VSCAKAVEPIEMAFGLWTQVGTRKHVQLGSHWRHLANTTDQSMCGGDSAFLSNYFDHLLLLLDNDWPLQQCKATVIGNSIRQVDVRWDSEAVAEALPSVDHYRIKLRTSIRSLYGGRVRVQYAFMSNQARAEKFCL